MFKLHQNVVWSANIFNLVIIMCCKHIIIRSRGIELGILLAIVCPISFQVTFNGPYTRQIIIPFEPNLNVTYNLFTRCSTSFWSITVLNLRPPPFPYQFIIINDAIPKICIGLCGHSYSHNVHSIAMCTMSQCIGHNQPELTDWLNVANILNIELY